MAFNIANFFGNLTPKARSPLTMKCWKGFKKVELQDSPSGKKDPDGSPKQVNDCESI